MTSASSGSPGGVGDGLPSLPTGEPVLARWFVLAMLALTVVALAVTAWALLSFNRPELSPAERRPPGTGTVTHQRGEAALADVEVTENAPDCAPGVEVVGDEGSVAAGQRALSAVCTLLEREELDDVVAGIEAWGADGGQLRFAAFELSGVDSSMRIVDERPVVELNAKFQFEDATRAAPFVMHELVHLGRGIWPGTPVDAADELAAIEAQARACDMLVLGDEPPRGCNDARELLDAPDPDAQLREAGY